MKPNSSTRLNSQLNRITPLVLRKLTNIRMPNTPRFKVENEAGQTVCFGELDNINAREYIYLSASDDSLTLEEIKTSLQKYRELLHLTQCQYLIIDTRKYHGSWNQLSDCLETELYTAKENGLKYCAHIVPREMLRVPTPEDDTTRDKLTYRTFSGAALAVGWLETCKA